MCRKIREDYDACRIVIECGSPLSLDAQELVMKYLVENYIDHFVPCNSGWTSHSTLRIIVKHEGNYPENWKCMMDYARNVCGIPKPVSVRSPKQRSISHISHHVLARARAEN